MITKLQDLIPAVQKRGKKKLVAAYANDPHTILAISDAVDESIIEATLVGNENIIKEVCKDHGVNAGKFTIIQEKTDTDCVAKAVAMVHAGMADILMKGLVSTDRYMKGILNRDSGLVPPRGVLSHVAVMEIPTYHKLLAVSDVAIIPAPDIDQKIAMTRYLISVSQSLGVETPRVALIAPTEQMLHKLPSCVDAAIISKMGDRNQIPGAYIDGPLALDVAIDKETADLKKLDSPIDGNADCLVFPSIESANAFFKTATKLCNASLAGIIVGAKAPCVLTSRGDSEKSKLYSIALAALYAK